MTDRETNKAGPVRTGGSIEARDMPEKSGHEPEDSGPDRVGGNLEQRSAGAGKKESPVQSEAQQDRKRDGT